MDGSGKAGEAGYDSEKEYQDVSIGMIYTDYIISSGDSNGLRPLVHGLAVKTGREYMYVALQIFFLALQCKVFFRSVSKN